MVTGKKKASNSFLYRIEAFDAALSEQYYSFSVLVAPTNVHLCVKETTTSKVLAYEVWNDFETSLKNSDLTSLHFKEVLGLFHSEQYTAMPYSLYEENQLTGYLTLNFGAISANSKCLATLLPTLQLVGMYTINENDHLTFTKQWPYAEINHPANELIQLTRFSNPTDGIRIALHFYENAFIVTAFYNQSLLWVNQFSFDTPEDVLYFLLNGLKQLDISPDSARLSLLGDIHTEHNCYTLLATYFPDIAIEELKQSFANADFFATFETAKHQMLLHQ